MLFKKILFYEDNDNHISNIKNFCPLRRDDINVQNLNIPLCRFVRDNGDSDVANFTPHLSSDIVDKIGTMIPLSNALGEDNIARECIPMDNFMFL